MTSASPVCLQELMAASEHHPGCGRSTLILNQWASLDVKGPVVEVTTLLWRQPCLQGRSLLGPTLPFRPSPSPTRSSHPIQWGFLPLSTPGQGKLPGHPPPPAALGNETGGLWDWAGEAEGRAGGSEGSERPPPHPLRCSGSRDLRSFLSARRALGGGVRGLATAAPSSPAGHQLGELCYHRP